METVGQGEAWGALRQQADAFAEKLQRRFPSHRVLVEEASSERFPASLFLTIGDGPDGRDVVFEIARHIGEHTETEPF